MRRSCLPKRTNAPSCCDTSSNAAAYLPAQDAACLAASGEKTAATRLAMTEGGGTKRKPKVLSSSAAGLCVFEPPPDFDTFFPS